MSDDSRALSWARRGAALAGVGLVGVYAYGVAKFRRTEAVGFELPDPPAPGSAEFARLIEATTGARLRQGNRVTILRNGRQMFPAMLEAISSAKETIDFSSYIYWPGDITDQFSDAFGERAEAGVEVNVILDGYGSAKVDHQTVERMERAGVTVSFFRPPSWYTIHKANNRMHRRLLIVDGKVAFAGGVGIADMWTGDAQDPEHWRETHARIEGPAVRDIVEGFQENWTEATRRLVGTSHVPELESFDDGVAVQVTRSSPSTGATAVAELFYAAIVGARRRLWITTAYFTAGSAFLEALCAAARRGVDVRILVAGRHVDKKIVRKSAQRAYGELLDSGVRIFEYDETMLHAKTMIVDDGWADIGSSNFDHRSFALDAELNVSVFDIGLITELERHFVDDLEVSEELDAERWRNRSLTQRAGELAADIFRQSF
ncbi:MAG TPA: phospholipase D-like domain-containing protein [Acidimicrobiales bacterium]|nr:phospholipase D-like domain-containing protein [Acidimicrobiales bacterium]